MTSVLFLQVVSRSSKAHPAPRCRISSGKGSLSHIPWFIRKHIHTHFHSCSVKPEVLQSYRLKHSLLLKMEISLPRQVIPKFSASQHFWSHFWVRSYLPELNLSWFLLLSACIKPLQIFLWAKIKSESGNSWWRITFSLQRINYFFLQLIKKWIRLILFQTFLSVWRSWATEKQQRQPKRAWNSPLQQEMKG